MKRLGWIIGVLGSIVLLWLAVCAADETAKPRDGRLDDPFLENLVGEWRIARRIRGAVVGNTLTADWVLQHQFLRLHMKDVADPPQYEAEVLIGYDVEAKRYVAHWCDSFGAQYSAVGYGTRIDNTVEFVFSYPDGPFHNTFTWHPTTKSWTFLMEAENEDGTRTFFAADTVRSR